MMLRDEDAISIHAVTVSSGKGPEGRFEFNTFEGLLLCLSGIVATITS
jgi:hypothetical protein